MRPFVVIALLTASCTPSPPPPGGRTAGRPPDDEAPRVWADELAFGHPVLGERFGQLGAAARRRAGPDWRHDPLRAFGWRAPPPIYRAAWVRHSLPPGQWSVGPLSRRPNHGFALYAHPEQGKAKTVGRVVLEATWLPEAGWGVLLSYTAHRVPAGNGPGRVSEHTHLTFLHEAHTRSQPGDAAPSALTLGASTYAAHQKFGPYGYALLVSVNDHPAPGAATPGPLQLLRSEEGFRKAALAELDRLEVLAREQIPSGQAIREAWDSTHVRHGGTPPVRVSPSGEAAPTAARKQEMLRDALREVDRRRGLVRVNSREMFAAAGMAFPLAEALEGAPGTPTGRSGTGAEG